MFSESSPIESYYSIRKLKHPVSEEMLDILEVEAINYQNSLCLINNRTSPTKEVKDYNSELALDYDCQENYSNFFFYDIENNKKIHFYCKSWRCSTCYDRQRRKLKRKLIVIALAVKFKYFWSFTIEHKVCDWFESYEYIFKCWNKFLILLRRRFPDIQFVRVNESHKDKYAHLHFLTIRFLPVNLIRSMWVSVGGGVQMKVKRITGVEGMARYMGKYLTKDTAKLPKGKRHYSISKDLQELLPKAEKNPSIRLMIEVCIEGHLIIREVCRQDWSYNYFYVGEVEKYKQIHSTL